MEWGPRDRHLVSSHCPWLFSDALMRTMLALQAAFGLDSNESLLAPAPSTVLASLSGQEVLSE